MAALSVQKLQKSFGGLRVTDAVDLTVEPGERRLIIGPNGAGKTTLFNLITGELSPDAGSITLFGRDITRVPSHRRPHLGIARTYQIITLFPRDTLLRNVTLSLLGLSKLRWNPLIRLDGQPALIAQARNVLARVALDHLAERPLAQTSYGERRRVEIPMALAPNSRVLLRQPRAPPRVVAAPRGPPARLARPQRCGQVDVAERRRRPAAATTRRGVGLRPDRHRARPGGDRRPRRRARAPGPPGLSEPHRARESRGGRTPAAR